MLETEPLRPAEVCRFHIAALILVPLFALVLQAYLPLYFNSLRILELPLLVVIYFALARRSPVAGVMAGAVVGIAQDSLSRDPIGVYAVSETVAGFLAGIVSSRMEADSSGVRFLVVLALYYVNLFAVYALQVALLGQAPHISLRATIAASLVNAVASMLIFKLLDRFRKPA
ncbi:MAG: rod shape-determining protein MreD [Acidobacteria bacterium]|nr:rod shape-determining protein MreD [Acidobacteriota bacterium]